MRKKLLELSKIAHVIFVNSTKFVDLTVFQYSLGILYFSYLFRFSWKLHYLYWAKLPYPDLLLVIWGPIYRISLQRYAINKGITAQCRIIWMLAFAAKWMRLIGFTLRVPELRLTSQIRKDVWSNLIIGCSASLWV